MVSRAPRRPTTAVGAGAGELTTAKVNVYHPPPTQSPGLIVDGAGSMRNAQVVVQGDGTVILEAGKRTVLATASYGVAAQYD